MKSGMIPQYLFSKDKIREHCRALESRVKNRLVRRRILMKISVRREMEWQFEDGVGEEQFPVGLYLMLKNICKGQNRLAISELTAEKHFGTDATASDLGKELELLREAWEDSICSRKRL